MLTILIVIAVLTVALCQAPSAWAQGHYRWVDKDGNVHYTQTPPPAEAPAPPTGEPKVQTPPPRADVPKPVPPMSEVDKRLRASTTAAVQAERAKDYPQAARLWQQALREAEEAGRPKFVALLTYYVGQLHDSGAKMLFTISPFLDRAVAARADGDAAPVAAGVDHEPLAGAARARGQRDQPASLRLGRHRRC
jgi:hypothetical protein